MMKIGTLFRNWKILSVSFLGMALTCIPLFPVQAADNHPGERILLEVALHKISQQYDVYFNYDRNIMEGVMVDYEENKGLSLTEALDHVFENTQFGYRVFEERYVVVFENNNQGTESLKNMISHMQDLVEERESENKRIAPPVTRLATISAKDLYHKRLVFSVSGTVTDEEGEPLIGVNIQVKGSSTGTSTDFDGNFTLNDIDENAVLVVSYVGYQTQEVSVSGKSNLDIVMISDSQLLDEVVVVGYGTQRKSDLTGAVSSIDGDVLKLIPAQNVLQSFQGQMSGVDITSDGGAPGDGFQIRIRGNRSINADNEPLVVIDGIPSSLNLNDIPVGDISSLELLKDASATSIYGSRGANGVILITTNRGKTEDGGMQVNYEGYYGRKSAINNINYRSGEEFAEFKRIAQGYPEGSLGALTPAEKEGYEKGVSTDWVGLILQTGEQQNHYLSAYGGNGVGVDYYISANYYNEKGVLKGGDYENGSVRARVNFDNFDKFNLDFSSFISTSSQDYQNNNMYFLAGLYTPLVEPVDEFGNHLSDPNNDGLYFNPLGYIQPNGYADSRKRNQINITSSLTYEIVSGLTYKLNAGAEFLNNRNGVFEGSKLQNSINKANMKSNTTNNITVENMLNYTNEFGDSFLDVLLMGGLQKYKSEFFEGGAQHYPIEDALFFNLGLSDLPESKFIGSELTEWSLLSWMGRTNYRYKNKYLVTITGRADGSSRLSTDNKWSFFPSIALSWNLSNEQFMKNTTMLSDMKLRISYGSIGNTAIEPYQTLGGLKRSSYNFGGDPAFGFIPDIMPNPFLGWEKTNSFNVGVNIGLFKNKIIGDFDIYDTKTTNLLLNRRLPITSGYEFILENIGSTRNRGVELSLTSFNLNKGKFDWKTTMVFSRNKESILSLVDNRDNIANNLFIGHPINTFYDYEYGGIWQVKEAEEAEKFGKLPGDVKLVDNNGRDDQGRLTGQPDGKINGDDRIIIGSGSPKFTGGITNYFTFGNLDLSIFTYFRYGQYLKSIYHDFTEVLYTGRFNMPNLDYWTPDNPNAKYPKPGPLETPEATALQYFDGSFFKVKNISLGYSLKNMQVSSSKFKYIKIYCTAYNPFIFSKFKLVDPEVSNGIVDPEVALSSRSFIIGLNIKF